MYSLSKTALLTLVGIVSVAAFSQNAHAGFVYGVPNTIGFQNRENVFFNTSPGSLHIGDSIQGVLRVDAIAAGGNQPVTPEITGIFDITVAHILDLSGNVIASPSTYSGLAVVLFRATNNDGVTGLLGGMAAGTTMAFYEGGPADLLSTLDDPGKTTADAIAAASDGTLQGTFGFGGNDYGVTDYGAAGNGYWYATVGYAAGLTVPTANFYYGLQAIAGPLATTGAGPVPLQNSAIDAVQTGVFLQNLGTQIADNQIGGTTGYSLVGKGFQELNDDVGLSNGTSAADRAKFAFYSNDPASVHPSTPEPASIALALMGGGLFVPMARRRRQQKSASAV
ncbi:MAG TPA: PEP-CTERM sorting domain-containing protein [Caulifigura sp.]|jgi:hypothetical protein|nr:PEP-CTERM sorting domain-containing protein [Caulifigura sp.]